MNIVNSLATIFSVLVWVPAIPILMWLERRTVRRRERKPIPSDVFQRAWTRYAESFVSAMKELQENADGAGPAVQLLKKNLKREFPLYWKSILARVGILVRLLSEHPGLFLHWINPAGDPARFFRPAVLAAVASVPLSCSKYPKFDKLIFLNLMERAATGMDAEERTPGTERQNAVNGVLVAITSWTMQCTAQLRVRLVVPVSPDIFRQAWNEMGESFLSLAALENDDERKAAERSIKDFLEQHYPAYDKAIACRGIGLAHIAQAYPVLFSQWIQKDHGDDRFHLSIYSTAATMPLRRRPGLFNSVDFFDLAGRATVRDEKHTGVEGPVS